MLEEQNDLAPKDNYLEDDMDDVESSSDEEEGEYRVRHESGCSLQNENKGWEVVMTWGLMGGRA